MSEQEYEYPSGRGAERVDETMRALLQVLPESVVVVDHKGCILFLNDRAQALFGYAAAEVEGNPLAMFLPERCAEIHGSHLAAFFNNPQSHPMRQGMDLTARRKNGEEFPVEVSLSFLNTTAGILALAFIVDISQRNEREWDLQARNQELDAFAHMVAHDLKSSLTLLIGYADLLLSEFTSMSDTEVSDMLDTIVRSGRKMNTIIQELLLFAGLRNKQFESGLVSSQEIIHSAMLRLSAEIDQNNAQIEIPDKFVDALGYDPWLEEVWLNYLSNAIKYGGRPPIIRIGSEKQGALVRFWVKDNGKGLTLQQQEGLFQPFTRRHTDILDGHGLGLSIVKRIVTKLGGFVGVESTLGEGSTFYFALPAAPTDASSATQPSSHPHPE